jgi:ATP-dependent DNA helicase DinG
MVDDERPRLTDALRALARLGSGARPELGLSEAEQRLLRRLAHLDETFWTTEERREVWRLARRGAELLAARGIDVDLIPPEAAPSQPPGELRRRAAGEAHDDGCERVLRRTARPPAPVAAEAPSVAPARWSARAVLGPGGAIARRLPGYELREQQLQLAERAIAEGKHAVIEAGTGTGKSLGYLVPGLLSGKRMIVSTANKSLQEQLARKDVPFLQAALPRRFSAVVLKGRGNYLCLLRLGELRDRLAGRLRDDAAFRTQEAARAWPRLEDWSRRTGSGDLEEAPFGVPDDLKELVTVDAESCLGARCPLRGDCFAEQARAQAREADLVIVNHWLLLSDLALRQSAGEQVAALPDAPLLVVDEAQHLEDCATDTLGTQVSLGRWERLARRLEALTLRHPAVVKAAEESEERERAEQWRLRAAALGSVLAGVLDQLQARLERGRTSSQRLGDERSLACGALAALEQLVEDLATGTPFWLSEEQRDDWAKLAEQVARLAEDLELIVTPGDEQALVRFAAFEAGGMRRRLALYARPIDVSGALREQLFGAFPTVIATSATLATEGGFGYWRARVGLDQALELVLGSPFDVQANALLYLPLDGARLDPARARARGEADYLLDASDGRAFCLFSSNRALDEVYRRLRPRLHWLTLRQGEGSRPELLRRFKEDGHAVLFGLKSFWEGVDVQGEALSLVVIDKLPFPPPDDPVWAARCAVARDWFNELALPYATLQLKQGFGRLLRTRGDRGVVALLDGRLTTREYGARILRALPPASRTRDIAQVRAFFGG